MAAMSGPGGTGNEVARAFGLLELPICFPMVSFSLLGLQHPEPNGSRRATPTSTFQHRPGHPQMRNSLLNQGITESTVFPDLEGLARETKRHFGFEV
jgi:hypothetical protein